MLTRVSMFAPGWIATSLPGWTGPARVIDDECMILATLLLSLFLGPAVVDTSMSAPRKPDYWEAWGVVFVKATCDADGRVLSAEVARGTAAPAVLDSLVALVKAGAFEIRTRWDGSPDSVQVVPFVTERHPRVSERAGWVGMPDDIRGALARFPLDVWLRGMLEIDPEFDLDDFLFASQGGPWEEYVPGYLAEPDMMEKRELGLLLDSPDGLWVLDPFHGGFVGGDDRMGWDADNGFSISDASSGARIVSYVVGPGSWSTWATTWIGLERCLLVGSTQRDAFAGGTVVLMPAPAIWELNLVTRTLHFYIGAPIRPEDEPGYDELGYSVLSTSFPKINWRD